MALKDQIKTNRDLMKSNFGGNGHQSDQQKGLPQPPLEKPRPQDAEILELPEFTESIFREKSLLACLRHRRSRRRYLRTTISLEELSFLLWSTQGVDEVLQDGYATLRPAPSAGARHPFETYLAVNQVEDVPSGVYRYLPLSHRLIRLFEVSDREKRLTEACMGQGFVGSAPVVFIWSCIPYRGEWRYAARSHKVMLIDVGHVCQNLYLAAESIGGGTCAIGAYDQAAIDRFLRLDGEEEYVVYLAPVGRVEP